MPSHSPCNAYLNCAWNKLPPSSPDNSAVIDGAVNDNLLATILSISLFNLVNKSPGVSASILSLQSELFSSSQVPAIAISWNFAFPPSLISLP